MMPMSHSHSFPVSKNKLKTTPEPAMHSTSITNPVSPANYNPKTAEKVFCFNSDLKFHTRDYGVFYSI